MNSEFVKMAIRAFMEGRSRSAQSYVEHRFSAMDDRTLAALGRSRASISKVEF